ncbi:MAG: histidine kinase N-terminal 7TM domain-containing protein, partial [Candidatus Paceibacteria bacterium]
MNIYAISAAINLIIFLFVGGVIWRRGEDRRLVNALGLFSLTLAIWSLGYIFWQLSTSGPQALFWSRMLMMGAIFVTITFVHFTLVFLNKTNKYKGLLYGGYGLMTFFGIANYTDYFVSGVKEILFFPYWPQPGILFHPFLAIWFFYAGFGIYLLYRAYATADEETQNKIWYLLIAIVITYVGGGVNYLLWYGIKIPPVSTVSVSLFQILVAYAIAKHQLFNMKVIIT